MDISTKTVAELQALAYLHIKTITQAQNDLQIIENLIAEKSKEVVEPPKKGK